MSADVDLDLVRALVGAVGQPTAQPADIEAVLAAHGPMATGRVLALPAARCSADVLFRGNRGIDVPRLESAFGRARPTHTLDGDGGAECYWDVPVTSSDHVILVAELDEAESRATGFRLTPYTL